MYSTTKKHKNFTTILFKFGNFWNTCNPIDIITMSLIYADEAGLCIHTSTNHILEERMAEILSNNNADIEKFYTLTNLVKKNGKVFIPLNIILAIEYYLHNPDSSTFYCGLEINHKYIKTVSKMVYNGCCTAERLQPLMNLEDKLKFGLQVANTIKIENQPISGLIVAQKGLRRLVYSNYISRIKTPKPEHEFFIAIGVQRLAVLNQYDKRERYSITTAGLKGINQYLDTLAFQATEEGQA